MSIDGSQPAGHEHEGAGCQGVGGGDPGCLAGCGDVEGGCDVQAAAHAGAEGEHGDDVGEDEEDGDCGLAALGHCVGGFFGWGRWV